MALTPNSAQIYQQKVATLRQSAYLEYPNHVQIETLALCPAACNFCPYPTLTRKGMRLDDAVLDKVLCELEDIPRKLPFQLSPFKVNEPFLDNRLQDLLRRVSRRLPNAEITLTTNAAPLTENKVLELNEIWNLKYLWISLNENNPEAYTRVMQLPWERTESRLNMLHQLKAKGRLHFRIVLSRVGDGSPADLAFVEWVKTHFPLFEAAVTQRGDWIGQVDTSVDDVIPDLGCLRWFDFSITATGMVAHCCMDGEAKWTWGDVSKQHLLEIYRQPAWRQLREQTLSRREVEPCNNCTFV